MWSYISNKGNFLNLFCSLKSNWSLVPGPFCFWSRFQTELLKKTNEAIEDNGNFRIVYADMHSNLKFILNNPLNGKYVKHFRNENDIIDIASAHCEEGDLWSIFFQLTSYMLVIVFLFASCFSSFVEVLIFIFLWKRCKMN